MASPKYRPDIDGLRALAVLPVLFFHAEIPGFTGGYIGVDVFFVISGFLITTILHGEMGTRRFSVAKFYERRIRRLWPAIGVVTAVSFVGAWFLLLPTLLKDFGQSLVAVALFSSNILFYLEAGYFDGPAELKPLLHTWSLAVEEQFYVFFPPFLWVCHRFLRNRIVTAVGVLALVSFVACLAFMDSDRSLAFYMLPFRAWELLLGSLLAVAPVPLVARRSWASALGMAGILLIVVCIIFYDAQTPFPGWAAVPPCLGSLLVIHAGRHPGALSARWLGNGALVFVGKISYSLYLWHWPLIVYARIVLGIEGALASLAVALASILAGAASWRFVEQPFRKPPGTSDRRLVFLAALAVSLGWVVVGGWLHLADGAPWRLRPETRAFAEASEDFDPNPRSCGAWSGPDGVAEGVCVIGDHGALPPTFLFWGDSHAGILVHGMDRAARRAGRSGLVIEEMSCPPLRGVAKDDGVVDDRLDAQCVIENALALTLVEKVESIRDVVLVGRWSYYLRGRGIGIDGDRTVSLSWQDGRAGDDVLGSALTDTVAHLRGLGKRAHIVAPVPEMAEFDPRHGANRLLVGGPDAEPEVEASAEIPFEVVRARAEPFISIVRPLVEADPEVRLLDPAPWFCVEGTCRAIGPDGRPRFFDNNHVTTTMSEALSGFWATIFETSGVDLGDEAEPDGAVPHHPPP